MAKSLIFYSDLSLFEQKKKVLVEKFNLHQYLKVHNH